MSDKLNNPSTGPRTPEGKARSSQNARRHGLTSHIVLPHQLNDFNTLRNELLAEIQPTGPLETSIFEKLLSARWNMFRVQELEATLLDLSADADPLSDERTERKADLYHRYYLRFEGSFNRALKQLKDLQTLRALTAQNDKQPAPPLADPLKIQRFAKRTPPTAQGITEEALLSVFAAPDRAEIQNMAKQTGFSIPYLIAQFARHGFNRP